MERYETEEQQVEAIKQFWKDNGTAIILGAVIGLGGLWTWRWYNESQLENKAQASFAYSEAIEKAGNGTDVEIQAFISQYGDTAYGSLASLVSAQKSIDANDLEGAEAKLKDAISMTDSSALADVARIRLARVQVALTKLDAASSTLDGIVNSSFTDQVEEVRGDIYVEQNEFEKAKIAYASVLAEDESNQIVQTKLSNIAYQAYTAANQTTTGESSEE